MRHRILLALAPTILSMTTIPSVSAQANLFRSPVSFTLKGCTQLPAGLVITGSGESLLVISTRTDKDGNTVVEHNNVVTGTATDNNGGSYIFNYADHATITMPPSVFPFTRSLTDHFNLLGQGQRNQMQVGFRADVTVIAPNTFIISPINVRGDPMTCDAI
ncbi:MAG TPA: hypothetical protein VKU01_30895 [Bryobacteraceae bacterium]|nr:hypothetical protein [Bryobacteraceae bacterium]